MAHQHQTFPDGSSFAIRLDERRISRRTMLGTMAGLALSAGSLASFATSCGPSPTSPTSSSPQGTVPYTYRGHAGIVVALAWAPGGKRISSGSFEKWKPVQGWGAADGWPVFL